VHGCLLRTGGGSTVPPAGSPGPENENVF